MDLATIIHLCVDACLMVVGAALALLVVWHDPWRRSNQYFALCMALFAAYAGLNMGWAVVRLIEVSPEPLLKALTTFYLLGIVLVFNFVLAFAGFPRRWRRIDHTLSLPLVALFLAIMWLSRTFYDFEPASTTTYSYLVAPWARAALAMVLVYLVVTVVVLRRHRSPRAREFTVPAAILALGVIAVSFVPEARRYSLNTAALAVAAIMFGRLVLKYQVFQPLFDLNAELALKNAELVEASRLKSQFLANMSHELRTPLNSIIGYTELVSYGTYGELTPLQEDRLQKVTRNGRRLLDLINHVLDLSKIEAGRLDLNCDIVDTVGLLDGLLDEYQARAVAKGVSLVRGYDRLPPLYADRLRARQIVGNLLSNAVKFTEQGVVIVRARLDAERHQVVISVTDSGSGIESSAQEHIFEGFPNPGLGGEEGTGLGLVVARRLAEVHGGSLWFESVVSRGSTFHVALPVADPGLVRSAVMLPRRQQAGPIVLAVDDDHETLEVLQGHLESHGYPVYGAYNAASGLKLARELRPALITLDVRMPDRSGWEVLRELREDARTATIPVVMISAADHDPHAEAPGAEGYLIKPVQLDALLDQVRSLVGGRMNAAGAEGRR